MTHEFKEIIIAYQKAKELGVSAVLATVVDVEGSSYRRPGVGMLILENGKMIGAVSGGCVEKEVLQQAQSVFVSGNPKVITYDGKYRLGCEGLLYILIETFDFGLEQLELIKQNLTSRLSFKINSQYSKDDAEIVNMGSFISFKDKQVFSFSEAVVLDDSLDSFEREMKPCFRLLIIGSEHDAIELSRLASATKWEVVVVCPPQKNVKLEDFSGANEIVYTLPEDMDTSVVDDQTAIVLMNHNFAKDLLFLQAIKDTKPVYLGLLGPARRREKLLSGLIEYSSDILDEFIEVVHGPAGLNLGAETPEEIAISIIAEILSVVRGQDPIPLHKKKGAIHEGLKTKSINVLSSKT